MCASTLSSCGRGGNNALTRAPWLPAGRDDGDGSSFPEEGEGGGSTPGALALRTSTHRIAGQLVAAGRLGDAQRLLSEYNLMTDGVLENPRLAQALVVGLVESSGCAAGLATLPLVQPSAQLAAAVLRACAARRSVRGVSEVMAYANSAGLLRVRGPAGWRRASWQTALPSCCS